MLVDFEFVKKQNLEILNLSFSVHDHNISVQKCHGLFFNSVNPGGIRDLSLISSFGSFSHHAGGVYVIREAWITG